MLEARELKKFGMRLGAYDGANKRRFCFFEDCGDGTVRAQFPSQESVG